MSRVTLNVFIYKTFKCPHYSDKRLRLKMQWQTVSNYQEMSQVAATRIYNLIANASSRNRRINIGLATGNTMIELYNILADKLNRHQIKLNNLHTYNLDEYIDDSGSIITENHPLSYRKYMKEIFFSRLDTSLGFKNSQIHFPDAREPADFDRELAGVGGLDFQLLGIGFNGHIAFNEPAKINCEDFAELPSRIVALTALTLDTNARLTADGRLDIVPHRAVTMGMKSILNAREILLLACFREQTQALRQMRQEKKATPELPASYLITHSNSTVVYTFDKIKLD